ncbi:NADH-quinone oxidoreductase subunit N [Campylobacter hepaticus]|uniref:NADH-quinone oxidoreductase subunit N n=1 Tax=Campylobacter hepaticus TaxID=1813019 RepID=UPI0018C99F24|nr:NADH-quinone oxidoreductase subunit N [Campylobacter hepaticus]MCZ0772880.1 NADH-quinone oxidoreductase subunit N [Campylobacter hepaticus]MCZ0774349.1 NADH-quinone oxidoreductase subunit N [Campylobacter hepaticus]MCZ0775601.1 NADH-quinone oxidoreductase subunit N [Campylobacter hepaticus]MDX2323614.1 NADH-quinone oxidoreductase subunit N [Campylobacter hepaticus]MDX2331456.1 NADH-quinone oxidoreductase subunit N [Campylobacter hepaticus]
MLNDFLNLEFLNISLSYPFLFLIASAIVILLCSSFWKFHRSFYVSFSALSLIVSIFFILNNANIQGLNANAFLSTLNNDIISFYASLVILSFSFLYILMQKEENQGEFYALFLFMIASLLLMVSSSNLVLIFTGLESSSLALYTLIAMRGSNNAVSSAIKYFTLAAVGSGFFVMAAAFIYLKTGTLDLLAHLALKNEIQKDPMLLSAGVMIFVLCAIKLSLVPFHFWLKDVYYAAHTNLIAFISVVPKIAILAVVIRLFDFLNQTGFEYIIMVLVVFSMFAASFAALSQENIKKMFAYSSVVHSSLIILACIPLLKEQNFDGILFAIFGYWILFAFANYGIFMILSNYQNHSYEVLNGLLYKKPLIAFCLSISVLSLAAIPPFGVFWGKFMVLITVILNGYWYLALFVALSSIIMLYAYLKILIHALFVKNDKTHNIQFSFMQYFILFLCILVSVFAILLML